ncbi:hypothetical protein J4526_00585 [Desulfurococcaceae archaeon MEX13E-LK6-19]|nr:hypothetical protein J4526_00585 [Desulfurococcaceae archaeon MEX13E-LK6-19]
MYVPFLDAFLLCFLLILSLIIIVPLMVLVGADKRDLVKLVGASALISIAVFIVFLLVYYLFIPDLDFSIAITSFVLASIIIGLDFSAALFILFKKS